MSSSVEPKGGVGTLVVLSAPSGAGKTTIIRRLFETHDYGESLYYSVSHTSRPPRPGEVEGRDYHFVGESAFRAMIADGAFYEWADVHGQLKGTSKAPILERLNAGVDVLLDIDVQGAAQARALSPRCVAIFLLPPSFGELRRRLEGRGHDGDEQIGRRLVNARHELEQAVSYDYAIVNDRVDDAVRSLDTILRAVRQRRERFQPHIDQMLSELELSTGDTATGGGSR